MKKMKQSLYTVLLMGTAIGMGGAVYANPIMQIQTSKGNIEIELFEDKAPVTVKNFQSYVKRNFYNGTIFHRAIPGFMVQGGGFDSNMVEKNTQAPIQNEANNGLKNARGTLAMARTNQPNSATSQFFINVADNQFLNRSGNNAGYAVFAKVTKGMDVVDLIVKEPTGNYGMHQNVPKQAIVIKSVQIVNSKKK